MICFCLERVKRWLVASCRVWESHQSETERRETHYESSGATGDIWPGHSGWRHDIWAMFHEILIASSRDLDLDIESQKNNWVDTIIPYINPTQNQGQLVSALNWHVSSGISQPFWSSQKSRSSASNGEPSRGRNMDVLNTSCWPGTRFIKVINEAVKYIYISDSKVGTPPKNQHRTQKLIVCRCFSISKEAFFWGSMLIFPGCTPNIIFRIPIFETSPNRKSSTNIPQSFRQFGDKRMDEWDGVFNHV